MDQIVHINLFSILCSHQVVYVMNILCFLLSWHLIAHHTSAYWPVSISPGLGNRVLNMIS